MVNFKEVLIRSVLSGIYILIAAVVYLIVGNLYSKLVGSMLFSLGLLVIVSKNYNLYTGKVGYLFPYKKKGFLNILTIILGNSIGIIVFGLLLNLTNLGDLSEYAKLATIPKFDNTWYSALILSVFCGFLMYTAVEGYNVIENEIAKVVIVVFAVMAFIMAGFEHSIANIAYVVLSKEISFKIILYLIIMIIGNGIGAIILNVLREGLKPKNIIYPEITK